MDLLTSHVWSREGDTTSYLGSECLHAKYMLRTQKAAAWKGGHEAGKLRV
jgi:hypothetical protein